jgi:hypothetical protein
MSTCYWWAKRWWFLPPPNRSYSPLKLPTLKLQRCEAFFI